MDTNLKASAADTLIPISVEQIHAYISMDDRRLSAVEPQEVALAPKLAQISPVILSLEAARSITDRAIEKVAEVGIPYTITVLDGSGNLVLSTRMDGAALASLESSVAKARTAIFFGTATKDLAGAVASGQPLATIETSMRQPLAFVSGGVPIRDADGVVIGAVGAGGAAPDQDHVVAEYAAASYAA